MTKLSICVAQTSPRSGSQRVPSDDVFAVLESNLKVTAEVVKQASAGGADIVVFPEYWLQGLVQDREYLVHPARHLVDYLQHLAKSHNISICGTIVEPKDHKPTGEPDISPFSHLIEPTSANSTLSEWASYTQRIYGVDESVVTPPAHTREGDDKDMPGGKTRESHGDERVEQMINVAYVFEAGTGRAVGRYVKRNLWISERDYLTSGEDDHEVFELNGIKMGLLICWDLAHSAAAGALARQDVDVILAPTYWLATDSEPASTEFDPSPDYELDLVKSLCYTRAFETETVLAMCNAGGPRSQGFAGGSGAWAPFKGKLDGRAVDCNGLDGRGSGYDPVAETFEVELERLLKVARETYQIRLDWQRQAA